MLFEGINRALVRWDFLRDTLRLLGDSRKRELRNTKTFLIWWVLENIIYLYFHWHQNPWNVDQITTERCLGEKKRDKNDCWNRLVFIFHFRDNLITIWLWCFYLFCFLFSGAPWTHVYFACLLASFVYNWEGTRSFTWRSPTPVSLGDRTSFFLLQLFSKKLAGCQSFIILNTVFFPSRLLRGADKWDPLFVYSKREGGDECVSSIVKSELICTLVTRYQSFV